MDLRGLRVAEDLREALALHFTEAALMEHASVAAFARFVLQLLSLGAPPTLIADSQIALSDEVRHARLCFELASHYARRPIGPGALSMDGAVGSGSLREIVRTAFIEGCIGETCAAIEAAESANHAQEPLIAEILRGISEDETRHAELAFRFLKWTLGQMGVAERAGTLRELRTLTRDPAEIAETALEPRLVQRLLEHGVTSASRRRELREAAIRDIVLPCLGLLENTTPARHEATRGASSSSC